MPFLHLSRSLFLRVFWFCSLFFCAFPMQTLWAQNNTEHFLPLEDLYSFTLTPPLTTNIKNWNPEDNLYTGTISCLSPLCVSIPEVDYSVLKHGFLKRENIELVFQARQRILGDVGRLLPRIELSVGSGINPSGVFETISNLLGFLIPSNWFNWKESKLIYLAQKSSYIGILRNAIADAETLYYNIHRVSFDLEIYNYYGEHLKNFIEHIKANNRANKIPADDILQLENLRDEIFASSSYLNTIISNWYTYDVAVAMAYPHQGKLGIAPVVPPDLSKESIKTVTAEDLNTVRKKSTELLTLRYLIRATHYARLSRMFSFLGSSGSGNSSGVGVSLGLDKIADVRIESSQIRYLQVLLQENNAKLESTYRRLLDVRNGVIDLYNKYIAAKENNRRLFRSVLKKYHAKHTLDVQTFIRTIDWALKFELNRNFVQHQFLQTTVHLERLLVIGDKYERPSKSVPLNLPLLPRSDRRKILENYAIDRAVRNGELDLANP